MDDLDRFEPGTHSFSGTVRNWTETTAELVTDSGVVLFLDTRGQPVVPAGTHIKVETRKYRPCHFVTKATIG